MYKRQIPNLVSNYKKSVTENKLKAQVALISSAIQMAESKHGFTEEWPVCQNTGSVECTANYFDNYLAPELKVLNICKPSVEACWTPPKNLLGKVAYLTNSGTKHISAVLANGSSIYMWAGIDVYKRQSYHTLKQDRSSKFSMQPYDAVNYLVEYSWAIK